MDHVLDTNYEERTKHIVDRLAEAGLYGDGVELNHIETATIAAIIKALSILNDERGRLVNEIMHRAPAQVVRYPNIALVWGWLKPILICWALAVTVAWLVS